MSLEEHCPGSLRLDAASGTVVGIPLRGLRLGGEGKGFPRLAPSERRPWGQLVMEGVPRRGVGQGWRSWECWGIELGWGWAWSRRQGWRGVVGNWEPHGNRVGWPGVLLAKADSDCVEARTEHGVGSRLGKKWVGCGVETQMAVNSDGGGLEVDLSEVGMGCRWAKAAGPVGLGGRTEMDLTWFGMDQGWR